MSLKCDHGSFLKSFSGGQRYTLELINYVFTESRKNIFNFDTFALNQNAILVNKFVKLLRKGTILISQLNFTRALPKISKLLPQFVLRNRKSNFFISSHPLMRFNYFIIISLKRRDKLVFFFFTLSGNFKGNFSEI